MTLKCLNSWRTILLKTPARQSKDSSCSTGFSTILHSSLRSSCDMLVFLPSASSLITTASFCAASCLISDLLRQRIKFLTFSALTGSGELRGKCAKDSINTDSAPKRLCSSLSMATQKSCNFFNFLQLVLKRRFWNILYFSVYLSSVLPEKRFDQHNNFGNRQKKTNIHSTIFVKNTLESIARLFQGYYYRNFEVLWDIRKNNIFWL